METIRTLLKNGTIVKIEVLHVPDFDVDTGEFESWGSAFYRTY